MVIVTKRNGQAEPFIVEKLITSILKSGATPEDAREIAHEIESKISWGMTTQEIRLEALRRLREKNPEIEKNYIIYERIVKKRK